MFALFDHLHAPCPCTWHFEKPSFSGRMKNHPQSPKLPARAGSYVTGILVKSAETNLFVKRKVHLYIGSNTIGDI